MWQCYIISELRTVWQISNPISKELEARDFSRVSVHYEIQVEDLYSFDYLDLIEALEALEKSE